jgi:hypothetical protein
MKCCNHNCRQGRDCPHRVSKSGAGVLIIIGITGLYLWVKFCWLVWRML